MNASVSKPNSKTAKKADAEDAAPNVDFEPADIEIDDDPGRVQRTSADDESGGDAATIGPVAPPEPEGIGEAEFISLFIKSFAIPKILLGPDWNDFDVSEDEISGAEAAGKSAFVLISRFMPRLLLVPQADLLSHIILAGGFIFGKYKVAMAITSAANMKPANIPETATDAGQGGDGLGYVKAEG